MASACRRRARCCAIRSRTGRANCSTPERCWRKRRIAFVADPDAVSTILLNRNGDFPRSRFQDRMLGQAYGANLLQAEKEDWRSQRRDVAQPMTSERANSLVPRLKLAAADMLDKWSQRPDGEPIDLLADARRLTLDALHRSLFASATEAQIREGQDRP